MLQWGRDLSIAEIFTGGPQGDCGQQSFNGAAISRSRKYPGPFPGSLPACLFNGAAISRSRKYALTFAVNVRRLDVQWGRDLSIAEISRPYILPVFKELGPGLRAVGPPARPTMNLGSVLSRNKLNPGHLHAASAPRLIAGTGPLAGALLIMMSAAMHAHV